MWQRKLLATTRSCGPRLVIRFGSEASPTCHVTPSRSQGLIRPSSPSQSNISPRSASVKPSKIEALTISDASGL